jgi:uncharacterized protein YceK
MRIATLVIMLLSVALFSGCAQVTSKQTAEKTFIVSTAVNDSPTDFDRRRLRKEADKVCPEGYDILSQRFHADFEMPESALNCAAGERCDQRLTWSIHCTPKEKEPFSIFGNF